MIPAVMAFLETTMHLRGWRHRTLPLDGHTLHYHEAGRLRGPGSKRIVLLHGLASSSVAWIKNVGALARRHKVLALDLPGFGGSHVDEARISVKGLTQAIVAFLDRLEGPPVVLVGQSLGGWIAVKAAAERPERVERLVLVNTAGVYYPEVAELNRVLRLTTGDEVRGFAAKIWHRPPRAYRWFTKDFIARMAHPSVVRFLASVGDEADFINGELGRLKAPTTIVWGASDRFIPKATVDVLVRGIKDSKVYWIPECGHIPQVERSRLFNRILLSVLEPPVAPVAA